MRTILILVWDLSSMCIIPHTHTHSVLQVYSRFKCYTCAQNVYFYFERLRAYTRACACQLVKEQQVHQSGQLCSCSLQALLVAGSAHPLLHSRPLDLKPHFNPFTTSSARYHSGSITIGCSQHLCIQYRLITK